MLILVSTLIPPGCYDDNIYIDEMNGLDVTHHALGLCAPMGAACQYYLRKHGSLESRFGTGSRAE